MNTALQLNTHLPAAIEAAVIHGDLSKLSAGDKVTYYNLVCQSIGLNPLTKPFAYIRMNGKEVLYAGKDASDQLRKIHGVSISITSRELIGDVYVVTAQGKDKNGKVDESTGAICITGLKGESLANAYMKAETKAKRRVTLSVCGLGLLDETEVDSIPGAQKAERVQAEIEQKPVVEVVPPAPEVEDPAAFFDGPSDFSNDGPEHPLASYVFPPAAKIYAGKTFGDVPMEELRKYVNSVRKWFADEKKTPRGAWAEIFENADTYLGVK